MTSARTFDANASSKGALKHLGSIGSYPSLIWRNRYMVQNFFRRDLMSRFHGSFLGAWWMLAQPLFMFLVYFAIFGVLYSRNDSGPSLGFALYLFSGVVCFHAMVEATTTCCGIIIANNNLVKKVAFPSEALPIHVTLVAIVIYLVGVALTLAVGLISGARMPGIELLYLPLVLIVMFMLILGIGLLLANINVFVRDVQQLWRIFTMAWFFLSPVFWYPSDMSAMVLAKTDSPMLVSALFNGNPAFSLMTAQRISLGGEIPEWGVVDFWGSLGVASLWAVGFLLVGYCTFMANKHKYADIV